MCQYFVKSGFFADFRRLAWLLHALHALLLLSLQQEQEQERFTA